MYVPIDEFIVNSSIPSNNLYTEKCFVIKNNTESINSLEILKVEISKCPSGSGCREVLKYTIILTSVISLLDVIIIINMPCVRSKLISKKILKSK